MELLKTLFVSRGAQLLARYIGAALAFIVGKIGADVGVEQLGTTAETLGLIAATAAAFGADLLIHRLRNGGKVPDAARLILLIVLPASLFSLAGCGKDARVRAAHELTQRSIENAEKNHALLHDAQRSAFAAEARAHIDTKWSNDLDAVERKAAATPTITPAQVVAEAKRLSLVRDELREQVDAEVAKAAALEQEANLDLERARRLNAKLLEYNNASPDFGALIGELFSTVKPSTPKVAPPTPKPSK